MRIYHNVAINSSLQKSPYRSMLIKNVWFLEYGEEKTQKKLKNWSHHCWVVH